MSTTCATDQLILSIQEVNPLVFTSTGGMQGIGAEVFRRLTGLEVVQLTGTSGLNITTFNGLTITPGKTYQMTLIYCGQGVWKILIQMMDLNLL
jgi:hypothetical protein